MDSSTCRTRSSSQTCAGGAPRTTIGQLARGLQRRAAGGAPITILSCDNLAANGAHTERLVRQFLSELPGTQGTDTLSYLDTAVTFPSTMVDRIVPSTDAALRERVAGALGVWDDAPVPAEPFTMWAIEDRFAAGRPTMGGGWRGLHRRGRPLRAAEGSSPQRNAFADRLPGCLERRRNDPRRDRPSRHRGGGARGARAGIRALDRGADRAGRSGLRSAAVRALGQHGAGPPHHAGGNGRLGEAASADSGTGGPLARQRRDAAHDRIDRRRVPLLPGAPARVHARGRSPTP